jgi:hypothetical protein
MAEFVEIEHKDIEGTARVSRDALSYYPGWTEVKAPKTSAKKAAAEKTATSSDS